MGHVKYRCSHEEFRCGQEDIEIGMAAGNTAADKEGRCITMEVKKPSHNRGVQLTSSFPPASTAFIFTRPLYLGVAVVGNSFEKGKN